MAALKYLVITMAVLIALGLALVVWRITTIVGSGGPGGFGEVSLDLPEGCRIAGATISGEHLVVEIEGPTGDCPGVHVLDLDSGAVLGVVRP
ncbi:MAG: hypothetical protein ACE5Q3_01760 [Alphaproteobacteria bacterium]